MGRTDFPPARAPSAIYTHNIFNNNNNINIRT